MIPSSFPICMPIQSLNPPLISQVILQIFLELLFQRGALTECGNISRNIVVPQNTVMDMNNVMAMQCPHVIGGFF